MINTKEDYALHVTCGLSMEKTEIGEEGAKVCLDCGEGDTRASQCTIVSRVYLPLIKDTSASPAGAPLKA